jgi:putative ABC transport system permease protein
MGIPLVRGRALEHSDTSLAPRVVVINETMARTLFPNEDPLGRPVDIQRDVDYEVVGVVGDVRVEGLHSRPRLAFYTSYLQQPTLTMRLAIRTAVDPSSLAEGVRKVVWNRDRDIPVAGLSSMDAIIARKMSNDKVVALSVALFASVAMLLAAFGLYGVLAYYVSRRTHEIGVRVALGAGARDLLLQVMKRGLLLVAAGVALGLVGAFWAARLLQQILFGIGPTDPATFVSVSFFFALVGLVACWLPARKSLKVNPVVALAVQ